MSPGMAYFLMAWVSATILGRKKEVKEIEAYEGEPSHRPPTTQGDIDAPAQRMPKRPENAPGRDRNSQDPKDRVASLQLLLPDDNAF